MFTIEELNLLANLVNAAIPAAVNDAGSLAATHHILTKLGVEAQKLSVPAPAEEDPDGEDIPSGS